MKKVILILIDSLMQKDLENIIINKSSALRFLYENSYYQKECITGFPTMTASVDATLMTGMYPDQHKIPGLIWYNDKEKRLIDYVNGTKTVLKLGINLTAKDALINLNEEHLSKEVKTIFEESSEKGFKSGSINFIIHRGKELHKLKLPLLLKLVTRIPSNKQVITGPEVLSIGSMHKPRKINRKLQWNFNQTIFKRYGINDSFAIEVSKYIISSGFQPDIMFIYLPDHDHYLHKYIDRPMDSLKKVDKKIAEILDSFGSWEKAIKQNVFIIIGDHGQTKIGKDKSHNIDLDYLFKDFKVNKLGQTVKGSDELIIANNERMAYIYPLKDNLAKVKKYLLTEPRIDFLSWKDGNKIIIEDYQGKRLEFAKGENYTDSYQNKWDIEGDFEVLDIKKNSKEMLFEEYPDALSRLYGAMFSQEEEKIIVNAKPGFEFLSKTFPKHLGGGSHGSLHRIDSTVPLLISGTNKKPEQNLRIVDLKNYILQLMTYS